MKSVVLCERSIVSQSEESKENLIESKGTEGNEKPKEKEKKIRNGSEEKKSEFVIASIKGNNKSLQNGERKFSERKTDEGVAENEEKSCHSKEAIDGENECCVVSENLPVVENDERDGHSNARTDTLECLESKVDFRETGKSAESIKISDAESSLIGDESVSEIEGEVREEESNTCNESATGAEGEHEGNNLSSDNGSEMIGDRERTREETSEDVADEENNLSRVTSTEEENEFEQVGAHETFISETSVEGVEGEKKEPTDSLAEEGNCQSSDQSCDEIRLGDCQTVSDSVKDISWSEKGFKEPESNEVFILNEESQRNADWGKAWLEGSEEKKMNVDVEPEQSNGEGNFNRSAATEEYRTGLQESVESRKRQTRESSEEGAPFKRKRLSTEKDEESDRPKSGGPKAEAESAGEGSLSLSTTDAPSEAISSEGKSFLRKRLSVDEENLEKGKSFKSNEGGEKGSSVTRASSSFLASFRGTLKSLTRSDLEELIVQKLCEAIAERSNVGELRRKAQALEQDQERWKRKVQTLTKQMREMEMVMKKYMSEVQKQLKEKDGHIVAPVKVARSVGLQVSFYSSGNRGSKPYQTQNAIPSTAQTAVPSPAQNANSKTTNVAPSKLPPQPQLGVPSPNVRQKSVPPFQKSGPVPQKPPANQQQQKRTMASRSDFSSPSQNRSPLPQTVNNRAPQMPVARPNYKSPAGVSQQQQKQQNGSKVIDLTEDDDRQTAASVAKPAASLRVVNHLPQSTVPQNNRFTYLIPTASPTSGNSGGQNRQVLIATSTTPQANRQLMCPLPPLLFKGGNLVQTSPQPQAVNSNCRAILPKSLRHPAPLPHQPPNQINRPSLKLLPPKPALKISRVQTGIVLSWNMSLSPEHAPISSYQLFAYQEGDSPPSTTLWKKVGDVKALPLPMACTLTQFMTGHKYHFAVRAVDLHSRIGPFSSPATIVLLQ